MAAGIATTRVGLHRTALAYCAVTAALAVVAAAGLIFRARHDLLSGAGRSMR